jgi:predicted regulator of Ras-like GTPase activity (Roadblock/LC7/MglB family)
MSGSMPDHGWLLRELVNEVPGLRAVILLSADGMPMSWHGIGKDDADRLAAMASAFSSLASGVGAQFCQASGVKQVAVELEKDFLLVAAAGAGSVLAALAGSQVDLSSLSYEMGKLCSAVTTHFDTVARGPAASSTGP